MDWKSRRIAVSIPPELAERLQAMKNESFYDKSYSELLRYILSLSLNSMEQKNERHHPT